MGTRTNPRKANRPSGARVREYELALGRRMKEMREDRGMKRKWVAGQVGIHYVTLMNWELGVVHRLTDGTEAPGDRREGCSNRRR